MVSDPAAEQWIAAIDDATEAVNNALNRIGPPLIIGRSSQDLTDPTETWRASFAASGQSTSAQLRQTQEALAASQADLTAMQAQRDEFRDNYIRDAARLDQASDDLARIEIERDDACAEAREWRAIAEQYLSQRDDALHDLAHAKFALSMAHTRLDHWKEQAETALGRLNELRAE